MTTVNNNAFNTTSYDMYQVDAFANKVFEGNPAAVIPMKGNTWFTDEKMQQIATENNLSETAFLISKDTGILLLQNEVPDEINLSASRRAIKEGAQVWLNAAPARKVSTELLKNLDLMVVNRPEAEFYKDFLKSDESSHLIKISTLGAEGLNIQFSNEEPQHHNAFTINVKSAHGAGDMFVGALAARYLKSNNFLDSLNFAQAAAALKVSRNVTNGITIKEYDVFKFLKNV